MKTDIAVIIPALNEELSIEHVLKALPYHKYSLKVIVCDNGSTDNTAQIAKDNGAIVVYEPIKGYGQACLTALKHIPTTASIITFIDADYSDYPEELPLLIEPIISNQADIVIGSRTLKKESKKALLPQAIFGNYLSVLFIKFFWKTTYTDLGPFRAISKNLLEKIQMTDRSFGWTIEMQIKVAKHKAKILEVPVSYRPRIGKSKISGTIKGSFMAGVIILSTIFKERFLDK